MDASAQAGGASTTTTLGADGVSAAWPITSIEVRGLVSDASATLGVNDVQVYTMATS